MNNNHKSTNAVSLGDISNNNIEFEFEFSMCHGSYCLC